MVKKSFVIIVKPTHNIDDKISGYCAIYGKYQTWSINRIDAIRDILRIIELDQNKRGYC